MNPMLQPLGRGEASRRPRIKVVGVGGAGCNAIRGTSYESIGICTSKGNPLSRGAQPRRVVLDVAELGLLGATSPKFLASINHDVTRRMEEAIGESDLIFIFTGLGGETGTFATPAVVHVCRKLSELVIVSAALPFSVESVDRRMVASRGLSNIVDASHMAIVYRNDAMLNIAPNIPLRQAFSVMNDFMMLIPAELGSVLTPDDLPELRQDFAGASAVRMGVGVGHGRQRWENAVREAFSSPWFDVKLEHVTAAVAIVTSDEDDPYMLNRVLGDITSRIPAAKVRYAHRTDAQMQEKVRVTLLLGMRK